MPDQIISKKSRRYGKIVLVIVSILVLGFILKFSLQVWLKHRLEREVNSNGKRYHLNIKSLAISFLSSSISLKEVHIYTDTATDKSHEGDFTVFGTFQSLELSGFSFMKAIFKKELEADELICDGINMNIEKYSLQEEKDTVKTMKQLLIPFSIHVKKISVNISQLSFISKTDSSGTTSSIIKNADLKADGWQTQKYKPSPFVPVQSLNFGLEEASVITADSFYTFKLKGMHFSDKDSALHTDSIFLLPNYSESEFAIKKGFETDRIHLEMNGMEFSKFRLKDYLQERKIVAQFISINDIQINVFRDKRIRDKFEMKVLVQDLLNEYKHPIKIDSLTVAHGSIEYKEHAEKANNAGVISFTRLHTLISNITNDTTQQNSKDTLIVNASALLMGKSRLSVTLQFPVRSTANLFYCSGSLKNMEAKYLNPILEKNAFLYVTNGTINSLHFNFVANKIKSSGKMVLLYDSLDIALKDKTTDDTLGLKEKILSFFARNVLMEKSNPLPHKPVREGFIAFERDSNKFIFNYCWKSILSGIKSSIGMKKSIQKSK